MVDTGTHSFLEPDIDQIRHQVRGILDSYSHGWDVLAELAQNAVDAIAIANPTKGHINITIDALKRELVFSDNGVGIDPKDIKKLLRPFGTTKSGKANQIGNKGVGLTFILFSTSFFSIETHHKDGSVSAQVDSANSWASNDTNSLLPVNISKIDPGEIGTKIRLTFPDANLPIWSMTTEQLVFWLRTRTAIGNTLFIWGPPLNCDVRLSHVDISGNLNAREFECNYLLPTEVVAKTDEVDLDEYISWRKDKDRSDGDKRKKLFGKIVHCKDQRSQAGRSIKIWSCFVPSRTVWATISEAFKLPSADEIDEGIFEGFIGGLFTSSKGMPTGIQLPMKTRGMAGYQPNFFIILEDPSLSFDIGRKSIQTRQQSMLKDIAADQFNRYLKETVKYSGGSIEPADVSFDREEMFNEIDALPDMNAANTAFVRRPNRQEATVAAIFYELMGKGHFPGLKPLISGYKNRYDLFSRLNNKTCVIEFKYDLSGLIKDVDDNRKMFDEVDVVVLWEVTEADRELAERRGLALNEFATGVISSTKSKFPLAQFGLSLDGMKTIDVLCISKIIN